MNIIRNWLADRIHPPVHHGMAPPVFRRTRFIISRLLRGWPVKKVMAQRNRGWTYRLELPVLAILFLTGCGSQPPATGTCGLMFCDESVTAVERADVEARLESGYPGVDFYEHRCGNTWIEPGDWRMVFKEGSHPVSKYGVAWFDTGYAEVFTTAYSKGETQAAELAQSACHEFAHLLGIRHDTALDWLYWAPAWSGMWCAE